MSTSPATEKKSSTSAQGRELILTRLIEAPRAKVYEAWTKPELLEKWFAPLPYTTKVHHMEVRSGGACFIVMHGPGGTEIPCPGVYLEVIPNERIVSTDAYTKPWEPSEKPFMTLIVTFEEAGPQRTRYTARVLHWTEADREDHEKMGFHEGWTQCAEQLAALVERAS